MNVLVTGSNGFIGSHVVNALLQNNNRIYASSRHADQSVFKRSNYTFIQVDFTDPYSLNAVFDFVKPDIVVHCGAMSKPDECEENQAEAYDTNVVSTVQLLLNAADYKSFFIFLSTDYVFNGEQPFHAEDDQTNPINYYGRTKAEAESAVKNYPYDWAIVRTVMTYGKPLYGRNDFVTMIAEKIKNNERFFAADDQFRTPTYIHDLTKGILSIIEKRTKGLFHICGRDVLTPYAMAMQVAAYLGIEHHSIRPSASEALKEKARRSRYGSLSIEKACSVLDYKPLSFAEGVGLSLS